ncbi:hypothetical protein RP75_23965 [Agrobacterium arsenijevicii]|uniref:Transposase n=1 Tax=Agrobacterium arsenijevicii TaxID=1585697 RepID=A0ABR5D1E1_9HYPH|nr:hypothetical protein RP75_23965 [Agrobacterium arsenijevicii]
MRIGLLVAGLRRILSEDSADLIQPFGRIVIRCQFAITERPGRRLSVRMLQPIEIFGAIAQQDGAVEFGVAAVVVVVSRIESRSVRLYQFSFG